MRKILALSAILPLMFALTISRMAWAAPMQDASGANFSPDQLDNLLAPVALYPDPLLAQVLLAATFPDEVDEAARFIRAGADPNAIDTQPWDVSVKAVAHYPTVVEMMADQLDWTTALGQAYAAQSTDVMSSVQRLRAQAAAAGNLVTTPQEQIVNSGGYIQIWPAQPQYLYVPVYDPEIVYFRRGGLSFSAGLAIGSWLNFDFDWGAHRVLYRDWNHGVGWMTRSRPYVHMNNVYVNARFRNVQPNRSVLTRPVQYGNLNRFNGVHRQTNYNNVRANNRPAPAPQVNNKIIQRNMNPGDGRISANRGRPQPAPQINQAQRAIRPQSAPARPAVPPRQIQRQAPSAFSANRSGAEARAFSQRGQQSRATMPRAAPRPVQRPAQRSAPAARPSNSQRGGRQR